MILRYSILHLSEFCYYSLQTEGILGIFILQYNVMLFLPGGIVSYINPLTPPSPPQKKNKKLADLDTGTVLGMFSTILRI